MAKHRPLLADTFCKAGGAGMGYHMAGFEVVGFDKEPQPNYPFRFIQWDVLKIRPSWLASKFAAVHGSPPCQFYSVTRHLSVHKGDDHVNLIPETRDLFRSSGLPYIIENVEGAREALDGPVCVCGSSLSLRVRRHRLFESNVSIEGTPCEHAWQDLSKVFPVGSSRERGQTRMSGVMPVFGHTQLTGGGDEWEASVAMGINWMTKPELNQAIPPAYTYHLGKQLLAQL